MAAMGPCGSQQRRPPGKRNPQRGKEVAAPRVSSPHSPPTHQSHCCCCQARLLVDEELLLPCFLLTAALPVAAPAPAVAAATGGGEPGHQNLKPSVGMDAFGSNW